MTLMLGFGFLWIAVLGLLMFRGPFIRILSLKILVDSSVLIILSLGHLSNIQVLAWMVLGIGLMFVFFYLSTAARNISMGEE